MANGPVGAMPISWFDWLLQLAFYREAKTAITGFPPADDPRLAAVRQRALENTRNDAYLYIDAGNKALQRQDWDEAAAQFAMATDKLPPIVNVQPFYVHVAAQPDVFQRLIQLRPDQPGLWAGRAQLLGSRSEWPAAASDMDRALALLRAVPDSTRRSAFLLHSLAAFRLLAGDEAGYCELCQAITEQTEPVLGKHQANFLSRVCSLSPAASIDRAVPLRLARQAVQSEPTTSWFQYAVGAALYRAGEYEQAIATLEKSLSLQPTWLGRVQNHAFLAMSNHRLGRHAAARDWLAKAQASFVELEQNFAREPYGLADTLYLSDWLAGQILLPEAEKLVAESDP